MLLGTNKIIPVERGSWARQESLHKGQSLQEEDFTSTKVPKLELLHPLSHFVLTTKQTGVDDIRAAGSQVTSPRITQGIVAGVSPALCLIQGQTQGGPGYCRTPVGEPGPSQERIWLLWGAFREFLLKLKNTQCVTLATPLENPSLMVTKEPIPAGWYIA